MQNRLKPCPFCGNEATFGRQTVGLPGTNGFDSWHCVQCLVCNAAIGYDDNRFREKDDALKAWNTRNVPDMSKNPNKELVRELVDAMKAVPIIPLTDPSKEVAIFCKTLAKAETWLKRSV